jgi:hypothetical protein
MAVRRQIGPAIISERMVTHTELITKGRNPNFPLSGLQSPEPNNSKSDWLCNSIWDLIYSPIPRKKGRRMTKIRLMVIQIKCKRLLRCLPTLYRPKIIGF